MMKEQFGPAQISKVIDQALVYQCACPAQVCKSIFELRELYAYQIDCMDDTQNNQLVHQAIAKATEKAHEIMEECLREVLEIEGWNTNNFMMPELLKKKIHKIF